MAEMEHSSATSGAARAGIRPIAALLLATTALPSGIVLLSRPASAQAAPTVFDVPAGPLGQALMSFGRQSGTQLSYEASIASGKTSPGMRGPATREEALARILAGSGLDFSFRGASGVLISASADGEGTASAPEGSVLLDTVTIGSSGAEAGTVYTPYETAAPVAHISGETVERFRGSSPADIFRGTPGVMSGEARNGAGAIDPNIRGMQGFGRVATTIDGAENSTAVYQGYQGVSNRTFVDPDFLGGVDITKGADAASWGNAGAVAMRTLAADDIVKPGDTWGIRVKAGMGGNTSSPNAGARAGYNFKNPIGSVNDPTSGIGSATPSPDGMDRPSLLTPTQGSGSVVAAVTNENHDFLAGYARRKQGNYHAGKNGPSADPVNTGTQPFCYPETCDTGFIYRDFYANNGLANYRGGEEVLNTQLETESWLAKLTARFGDDHTLQLGYTGFRSEAGDRLASRLTTSTGQAIQQEQTVGTSVDTYTARHRWDPESEFVDLKTNLYWTHIELRNPIRGGRLATAPDIGLPEGFRVGSDTDMWGGDISNLSKLAFDYGDLDLTYGLSYRAEDTRGSRHTAPLEGWLTPRDGIRHELAGFGKASYSPVDWLILNAGLRYSHFWSKDRFDPYERNQASYGRSGSEIDDGGFSPSAGVTFEPFDGTQFYVNYSNTLRAPSIFETVTAFSSVVANATVKPERSSNWEIGTNLARDGLFSAEDQALLKFGYFNWDVKDYLARTVVTEPTLSLNIGNIDRAKFSGLELSTRYELGGFTADLAANYFLDVEYCRTADTCGEKSLYGDYATNHVQPEYGLSLTLAQSLFEERLTLGGRVTHTGPRAIGHGDVTAQGASQFISPVIWEPYTLVDTFAEYKVSENLTAAFRVENVFDRFYVDPLSLVTQPGPGRTFYASLTGTLGGDQALPPIRWPFGRGERMASDEVDWTGLYAGVHAGGDFGRTWGTTTALNGSNSSAAARESAGQSLDGGLFGTQVGYNWQFSNRWVLGLEGDYSRSYLESAKKVRSTDPTLAANGHVDVHTSYDVDWTASLRPRIGYAFDNGLMAYATGGLALARETQWRDQYVSNQADQTQPSGTETTVMFVEKASATRAGVALGGGLEYALNDHWSLKGEYTYSRFGKKDFKFKKARAGTGRDYQEREQVGTETRTDYPPDAPICGWMPEACLPYEVPVYETTDRLGGSSVIEGRNATNALDLHSFKLGVNFRF